MIVALTIERYCAVHYPGDFREVGIVICYTEILTGKDVLWCFFSSEMSEKICNSTFPAKISVQKVILSHDEMKKYPTYNLYFSIEFGKKSAPHIFVKNNIIIIEY